MKGISKRIYALLIAACLMVGLLPSVAYGAASMVGVNQNLVAPPSGVGRDSIPVKIHWITTNKVGNLTSANNIKASYTKIFFNTTITNLTSSGFHNTELQDYNGHSIYASFTEELLKTVNADAWVQVNAPVLPRRIYVTNETTSGAGDRKFTAEITVTYQDYHSRNWVNDTDTGFAPYTVTLNNKEYTDRERTDTKNYLSAVSGDSGLNVSSTAETIAVSGTTAISYSAWALDRYGIKANTQNGKLKSVGLAEANSTALTEITGVSLDTAGQITVDNAAFNNAYSQPVSFRLKGQLGYSSNGGNTLELYSSVITLTPSRYTVTYTDGVDNETVFQDQVNKNLVHGTATPAFSGTPAREGYKFMGWSPTVANTVTANVTYTAQWEKKEVTNITISPTTATVKRGAEQQFTAEVTGTGDVDKSVVWSITGNTDNATAIDSTGELTVGSNETATSITVTAAAAADKTKTDTAKVTVPALTGIAITTPPTKTEYAAGESFDPAGMVVEATYSDGSSKDVTDYTFEPNVPLTAGDTEVTVSYTEGGKTKTAEQTITVSAVPAITTDNLPGGKVGTEYSANLAAEGTEPITWIIDSGSLPAGLALNGNTISGTPTEAGTFTFTVKAENAAGSNTKELSIVIAAELITPSAGDFIFTPPEAGELTYSGEAKTATVEAKNQADGMGDITVKYYNEKGEKVTNPTDAGTYTVKVDVAEGSGYVAATDVTYADWTFTIAKASLTITADSKTMTVGSTIPELTYTCSGFVGSDTVDSLTTKPTVVTAADGTIAGAFDITVSGAGAKNYDITYVKGKLTVGEAPAPVTYTVRFDANGGTGSMSDVSGVSGNYTLPACGFTAPEGKEFKAWQVNGNEKNPGDSIAVSGTVTVTALWEPVKYTITASASNVSLGSVTGGGTYVHGESVTLAATPAAQSAFLRWEENGQTVSTQATYTFTVESNHSLTAVFTAKVVIVSPTEDQVVTVKEGETAAFSIMAENAEGYKWFVDKNDGSGFVEISGADQASYITPPVTKDNNGWKYCCKLINDADTNTTSPTFTLQVNGGTGGGNQGSGNAPTVSASGNGIEVKYNGGNSFSTSNPAVPTSVEIDNVPVAFSGNGSSFTVSSIPANARWITIRWNSTSVTANFTPDGAYLDIQLPKTGDVSVVGYALMAVIAAAGEMLKK